MADEGRPPVRRRGLRKVPRLAVGLAAGFLAGAVVVVVAIGSFVASLDAGLHRKHLRPIPVDAQACPFVAAMHIAANQFQIAEPYADVAFDAHGNELSWEQTRARLDAALQTLETTIRFGQPHFPVRIRRELARTLVAVRQGRAQLPVARDGTDLRNRARHQLDRGQLAFGRAGDLVGTRCGVELAADDSTFFYPFGAMSSTTTTGTAG